PPPSPLFPYTTLFRSVLHLQLEKRVALLRQVLEVEPVAEVSRVLRQNAVAKEAEDRRVLPLQSELELGLELVQLVEMRHEAVIVALPAGTGPAPDREPPASDRARRAARARTGAPPGADGGRSGPARRWSRHRRAGGR